MLLELYAAVVLAAAAPQSVASGGPECAAEGACRRVGDVTFKLNGRTSVFHINRDLPWVTQGNIILFPGEAVVIRLKDVNGQLQPELVASGAAVKTHKLAEGEVSLTFDLEASGSMLTARSAYGSWVHYDAVMVGPDNRSQKTSICPLGPGKGGFEQWPHPIVQLAISNFQVVDVSKGLVCA